MRAELWRQLWPDFAGQRLLLAARKNLAITGSNLLSDNTNYLALGTLDG